MKLFLILIGVGAFITLVYLLTTDIKVRKQNSISYLRKRYVQLLYKAQEAQKKNKPVAEFYLKEAEEIKILLDAQALTFEKAQERIRRAFEQTQQRNWE